MLIHIIFGAPGTGKGTRGPQIALNLGARHISTGDLFRAEIKHNTEIGQKVKRYQAAGELVPDEIADPFIFSHLDLFDSLSRVSNCQVHKRDILLDGYPRTIAQGETLIEWVKQTGNKIGDIINLTAERETIIERISGRRICSSCSTGYNIFSNPPLEEGICNLCNGSVIQRPDDERSVTEYRLDLFEEMTCPVLDFFLAKGLIVQTIDTEK